jgi:hypothetical protein
MVCLIKRPISPEGVGLPVTVIPGNNVAALVAVAASNKPQAASNTFAAVTV